MKRYFKGRYFKCCTEDKTVAFIPAYHSDDSKITASLQVITDCYSLNLPLGLPEYCEKPLSVKTGGCSFGEEGIEINYNDGKHKLEGSLRFYDLNSIKYDIMGPFALVPFMQCRHSVYSMIHKIDGHIVINGEQFDFQGGTGYIEGDRGRSFPKRYIWTQSFINGGSLMLSVADIPFFGSHFTGIIGVVLINGKEYRIATYLGARVKAIGKSCITVRQKDYELYAELLKSNPLPLFAPQDGKMCRTIHESASCKAYYRFSYKGTVICEFVSDKAGFEFEYD